MSVMWPAYLSTVLRSSDYGCSFIGHVLTHNSVSVVDFVMITMEQWAVQLARKLVDCNTRI